MNKNLYKKIMGSSKIRDIIDTEQSESQKVYTAHDRIQIEGREAINSMMTGIVSVVVIGSILGLLINVLGG